MFQFFIYLITLLFEKKSYQTALRQQIFDLTFTALNNSDYIFESLSNFEEWIVNARNVYETFECPFIFSEISHFPDKQHKNHKRGSNIALIYPTLLSHWCCSCSPGDENENAKTNFSVYQDQAHGIFLRMSSLWYSSYYTYLSFSLFWLSKQQHLFFVKIFIYTFSTRLNGILFNENQPLTVHISGIYADVVWKEMGCKVCIHREVVRQEKGPGKRKDR